MGIPDLKKAIEARDWKETSRILKEHPDVNGRLYRDDYYILWEHAPLEIIQALLITWPDAHQQNHDFHRDIIEHLVEIKSYKKQWDSLDNILQEFPQVVETTQASRAAKYGASPEFLEKHWKETGALLHSVRSKDWETIGEMLRDNPQLAKDGFSYTEFETLWRHAPLETIRVLLQVWPEAYKKDFWSSDDGCERNLIEARSVEKQWDFLDIIFQEFPQVLERTHTSAAAVHGAPLEFLRKHWKEADSLFLYSMHNKDWEKFGEILKDTPQLAKDKLFEDDFGILWKDAPLEVIQVLLETWPEAYEMKDRHDRNLVEIKLHTKQWDFLGNFFQEFPQVLDMEYARTAMMHGAPVEFIDKYWKETGCLLYSIHRKDWEETSRILHDYPHLAKDSFSEEEFDILWKHAPLETIGTLLNTWPEACKKECYFKDGYRDLVAVKSVDKQWDFLDAIFLEAPQVLERKHASTAAMHGAPLEFLCKHWIEAGTLLHAVHSKDWDKFGEILKDNPQLAKDGLSVDEFTILWHDAPFETIRTLLNAWPQAYEMEGSCEDCYFRNLVQAKFIAGEREFLKSFIHIFPSLVTADDFVFCTMHAPLDIFQLTLEKLPNATVEDEYIIMIVILMDKLEHFRAILDRCPAATEVKDQYTHLTPLLYIFQKKEKINVDWIGPILKANPNAAKEKDFDGKNPLHLAYQHEATSELINMILQAYPEAENERDNLGRFPKDLANLSSKTVFTLANEALILVGNLNAKKNHSYPDNAVIVCRGDMLMRDMQAAQNEEDREINGRYSQEVLARHSIFETLLSEFSKMVGIKDKDVIQKAAVIQALAVQCLSNKNDTVIDFQLFDNPGYWYQQEILKLVMRVFCETQSKLDDQGASVLEDADECIQYLNHRTNGEPAPKPRDEYVNAYDDLTKWLTKGLDSSSYSLQGPVLKPLQSLFNKLFIRRGQASVSIIGDLVRATLLVDEIESLQEIVQRITDTFPNITKKKFRQPDQFDRVADFLTYVHDDLKVLPGSDNVLPYRFKANSSQKKKEEPLWYNFNFFLQIPEYHRVGFSEMFVACELQIGLAEEINAHRRTHVAYERDRILMTQPLLRNYDIMRKEEEDGEDSQSAEDDDYDDDEDKCTEDDNKLIEKVLFGKIASEVLIPYTRTGNENQNNILLFENDPFSLSRKQITGDLSVKLERLCLNNRSLNWHALDGHEEDDDNGKCMAFRVAGPYELDETKRYFVDSFVLEKNSFGGTRETIALCAHVGPYMIQIACDAYSHESEDIIIESGRNITYLEQLCPVPVGTTALEVIAYGKFSEGEEFQCDEMKLSLKVFDVY